MNLEKPHRQKHLRFVIYLILAEIVFAGFVILALSAKPNDHAITAQDISNTPNTLAMSTPSPLPLSDGSITLIGQLIPSVDSHPGSFGPFLDDPPPHPIEYHLYDAAGNQIKLSFDTPAIEALTWKQWLAGKPEKTTLIAEVTQQSIQTPGGSFGIIIAPLKYQPRNQFDDSLWLDWSGKWVSITGRLTDDGVLAVNSFQAASATTHTFAAQVPDLTLPVTSTLRHSEQVSVVGYLVLRDRYSSYPPPEHGYYAMYYYETDLPGNPIQLLVYENLPRNTPRLTSLSGDVRTMGDIGQRWVRYTGWKLYPPRYTDKPNLIEVQFVQEMLIPGPASAANMALTASPDVR